MCMIRSIGRKCLAATREACQSIQRNSVTPVGLRLNRHPSLEADKSDPLLQDAVVLSQWEAFPDSKCPPIAKRE